MAKQISACEQGEVWLCDLTQSPGACGLATLSREELARSERFFQGIHRRQYLAAHVALRKLIGAKIGQAPASLQWLRGLHRKPYVKCEVPLYFNISHSADMALIALSPHGEVGVDIEALTKTNEYDTNALSDHIFSPEERAEWHSLPIDERLIAFYQLWTRKEACAKAVGLGLHLPLSGVHVGLGPMQRQVSIDLDRGNSIKLILQSLSLGAGSVGAVAWASA